MIALLDVDLGDRPYTDFRGISDYGRCVRGAETTDGCVGRPSPPFEQRTASIVWTATATWLSAPRPKSFLSTASTKLQPVRARTKS